MFWAIKSIVNHFVISVACIFFFCCCWFFFLLPIEWTAMTYRKRKYPIQIVCRVQLTLNDKSKSEQHIFVKFENVFDVLPRCGRLSIFHISSWFTVCVLFHLKKNEGDSHEKENSFFFLSFAVPWKQKSCF